jgi:hypothetical protein
MPDPEGWTPDHCFVAQLVRLIERTDDGRFVVEFSDGSRGTHDGPLMPLDVVLSKQVR